MYRMAIYSKHDITTADITATDKGGEDMNAQAALTEAVYYILLSLVTPRHGYGIMQEAERMSQGRVKLAAGTLYGAINGLLEKGWIRAVPGAEDSRRKEYVLTDKGREALTWELDRLKELVQNGEIVLGGAA